MVINTKKVRTFVLYVKNKGVVTKRTQPFYIGIQYYTMVWHLRDAGIMCEDGKTKENEKRWKLTEMGNEVAKIFKKIEELGDKLEEMVN